MKRTSTLDGLLSIGICIVLSSCASNRELMTFRVPETEISERSKQIMADSLMSFKEDGSGSISVSVQGKMLFKPGSASIDSRGQKALRPLGEMLYASDDFTMLVKGISDTVAVKKEKYLNHWTLSEARAASIMSILITTMRERAEAAEAAERKALKKSSKAKNEAVNRQDMPEEPSILPQQPDTTKYVVILVNSL